MTDPRPATRAATPPPLAEPSAWHGIELEVNGEAVTGQVESRLLLVDFLRHRLGLTGTHVGCEQGSCGACTILLDGQPARACLTLAVQTHGGRVRTVESLTPAGAPLNRLQQAFHEEHALQCGFCTPGFLMSLTGLQESGADADEETIADYLDGNLCRCTGYVNIKRAAHAALARDAAGTP